MRSETPDTQGAVTPPAVSTAGEHGSSVSAVLPAEFPTVDQSTVCFPDRNEFFEKNDVDVIAERTRAALGEWWDLYGWPHDAAGRA